MGGGGGGGVGGGWRLEVELGNIISHGKRTIGVPDIERFDFINFFNFFPL